MTTSSSSPFIRMGGLDGPPKPPALGDAPAEPGRPSILPIVLGGLDGPPKSPALGDAPAEPGRPSILPIVLGGLQRPPKPPHGRSAAPPPNPGPPPNRPVPLSRAAGP